MTNKGQQYYLDIVSSLEIAEEIITSSEMDERIRQTFLRILVEAKKQPFPSEDWSILRERLAGWMEKKNANTQYQA